MSKLHLTIGLGLLLGLMGTAPAVLAQQINETVRVNQSGQNDRGNAFYAMAASNDTLYGMVCNIGEPDCHMLASRNYLMQSAPKSREKYTNGINVEIDGAIYVIISTQDLTAYKPR